MNFSDQSYNADYMYLISLIHTNYIYQYRKPFCGFIKPISKHLINEKGGMDHVVKISTTSRIK